MTSVTFFFLMMFFVPVAQAYEADCSTPVEATKTLIKNFMGDAWDRQLAATCVQGDEKTALQLKQVLDAKGIYIDYASIPNTENYLNELGSPLALLDPRLPEVQLEKLESGPYAGQWQISEHSIQNIQILYGDTFSTYVRALLDELPASFFEAIFGLQIWQYMLFGLILLGSWLAGRLIDRVVYSQVISFIETQQFSLDPKKLFPMRNPIVWLVMAVLFMAGLPDLQLPVRISGGLFFIARLIMSFSAVLFFSRTIDLLSEIFISKAELTESKLDDQLIPLLKRAGKTLVWILGMVFILQNMGVQVTALVAFGSVGGVAIALASKDTVENLFGSLVVFIDQPFQIGEYVIIDGSIEGVIEEVGFRSTRIRTLDKTLISVPNAKISHCTVNNFAKIPERRFKCTLSLRYDTTTVQMESFIEALRSYLSEHEQINSDTVLVYFSNMNSFSLDILVMAFINSNQWIDLVKFKHEAFLQFMRIAEEQGVRFAFPTTTIELEDQHSQQ
jgi:MscS family membrane protein